MKRQIRSTPPMQAPQRPQPQPRVISFGAIELFALAVAGLALMLAIGFALR